MSKLYRISLFCPDKVGLVAAVTGKLFDLGINLGDTSFAVLGSGAELTSVCDAPDSLTAEELKGHLASLADLKDADIAVKPFEWVDVHGPTAKTTHRILVQGGDNPGLVARLSEVFIEFEANIVRLNSEKIPGDSGQQYLIDIAVWIPEHNVESCIATIENTANVLQMKCSIQPSQG